MRGRNGDPVKLAGQALEHDPAGAPAVLLRADALAFSLQPRLLTKARGRLRAARQLDLNERERRHVGAIDAWIDRRPDARTRSSAGDGGARRRPASPLIEVLPARC